MYMKRQRDVFVPRLFLKNDEPRRLSRSTLSPFFGEPRGGRAAIGQIDDKSRRCADVVPRGALPWRGDPFGKHPPGTSRRCAGVAPFWDLGSAECPHLRAGYNCRNVRNRFPRHLRLRPLRQARAFSSNRQARRIPLPHRLRRRHPAPDPAIRHRFQEPEQHFHHPRPSGPHPRPSRSALHVHALGNHRGAEHLQWPLGA